MARSALIGGFLLLVACGSSSEPSMAEALKAADDQEAARKAEADAKREAVRAKAKKADALSFPWTVDAMKAQLSMGLSLDYAVTGVDEAGKPVEDTYTALVKGTGPQGIQLVAYHLSSKGEAAKQVQTRDWTKFGPFFAVEKPEASVLRRETVTVPAGSFDCVVVELAGFFGVRRTVWMVEDKPGVLAKVVERANASEAEDQTELTYTLTKLETKT